MVSTGASLPRLQQKDCLLHTTVFREWEFVLATRKYVSDMILGIFKENKLDLLYAEKLATACSELIENAYKYSPTDSDLQISLHQGTGNLRLLVRNFVEGDGQMALRAIEREIALVYRDADPREAFKKKVLSSLAEQTGKPMLGFAKIRLETSATVVVELEAPDLMLITVTFPFSPLALR